MNGIETGKSRGKNNKEKIKEQKTTKEKSKKKQTEKTVEERQKVPSNSGKRKQLSMTKKCYTFYTQYILLRSSARQTCTADTCVALMITKRSVAWSKSHIADNSASGADRLCSKVT